MTRLGGSRRRLRAWVVLACAIITPGLALGACKEADRVDEGGLHDKTELPSMIGQRVVFCDDGSRADVDYLGDGLSMAVTWLPRGKTETLRSKATGQDFRGPTMRATVAGGSIAFTSKDGPVRICHRTDERG